MTRDDSMSDYPYVPWISFDSSVSSEPIDIRPKTRIEYDTLYGVGSPGAAIGFLLKCIGSRLGDHRGYPIRRNALRRMYDHDRYRNGSRRMKVAIRRALMAREL